MGRAAVRRQVPDPRDDRYPRMGWRVADQGETPTLNPTLTLTLTLTLALNRP